MNHVNMWIHCLHALRITYIAYISIASHVPESPLLLHYCVAVILHLHAAQRPGDKQHRLLMSTTLIFTLMARNSPQFHTVSPAQLQYHRPRWQHSLEAHDFVTLHWMSSLQLQLKSCSWRRGRSQIRQVDAVRWNTCSQREIPLCNHPVDLPRVWMIYMAQARIQAEVPISLQSQSKEDFQAGPSLKRNTKRYCSQLPT